MPKRIEGGAKTKGGKSAFGVAILTTLKERLDKYLAKSGMSRNSFIAMAIVNELEKQEVKEMRRIPTTFGYIDAKLAKQGVIEDGQIIIRDSSGELNVMEPTFASDEEAQKALGELIEELEKE